MLTGETPIISGGIKCARRHVGRFMKYADVYEVAEEWEKRLIIFLYGRFR